MLLFFNILNKYAGLASYILNGDFLFQALSSLSSRRHPFHRIWNAIFGLF